ncbi:hypothetical protein GF325_13560 [Candidatus Bathyarchaeota archaeon]|nr:hypothetical protein [Candidatus Bathyarchaeota archaeon]
MAKAQEKVVVGDKLGVIEEFLPGPGTYEQDGNILASVCGIKIVNRNKLEVWVKPFKPKDDSPKPGDIIIAEVVYLRNQSIATNIFKVGDRFLFDSYRGTLHVSKMSETYIKNVEDGFRVTDIIRAKIVEQKFTEYELTTRGRNLGVIFAECVFCGHELKRTSNKLECPRCKYPNSRKFASDYGNVKERILNL